MKDYILKNLRFPLVLLFISFGLLSSLAQQTQFFVDREKAYEEAIELFHEKNYLSARKKFEKVLKQPVSLTSNSNEVILLNVKFYIAVCASEANENDAESLLLSYIKDFHETDRRRLIYFYLGKYYYNNKKYNDALEYFSKVNQGDLNNDQLYDFKFQSAYCYFSKRKFDEAKPLFASIKDIKGRYFYPATYYYGFICFYIKDYNAALEAFTQIEDSKMYSSVIPYYISQIYFFKKDYTKANSYINSNLKRDGVLYKEEMKFLLGQIYFQESNYERALPLLTEYSSKNAKLSKETIYQLGYCQYKTGDYTKAIENFKQLNLLKDSLGEFATYALADCYLKSNQKEKARSAFQSLTKSQVDPTIKQSSLFSYAKLSLELGYTSEAIQSFDTYTSEYPKDSKVEEANEWLAQALVQTKDYERAYKILETIPNKSAVLKETYQKVCYFRAVEHFNDKKYAECASLCSKSLQNAINIEYEGLATYLRAELFYIKGSYKEASQQYLKFVEYSSPTLEKRNEASVFRAYYNTGYCYFKLKNYSDASTYFGRAITAADNTTDVKGKNTLSPDLYLRYADCNFVTKTYPKALDSYSTIVANNWENAAYAQFQKGIILGLTGKDDEKVSAMNYLITKYNNSTYIDRAYFEIGETYLQKGDYTKARTAYQHITTQFPNSAIAPKSHLKIAVIDYNTGKKNDALANYKTVVTKFPGSDEANESIAALKDLYVELGRANEYFDFVKSSTNISISSSEQDSLLYQSAHNAYTAKDCDRAISLFRDYTDKFPNGFFTDDANWQKADCHIKQKSFADALACYEKITGHTYSKYYETALLNASGIAFFELKDYEKSSQLYTQLYIASSNSKNTYTALIGRLRSAVKLDEKKSIIEAADQFVNSGTAKDADLQEALHEKGKAYYYLGNKEFALGAFNRVTEMPVSERAVESKYMVAKILYEQGKFSASIDTCFKLKNKYTSYEFWVAKTFVLIADDYYALGNVFQAKATYESIVENYDGDANIVNEAKTKLIKIREEELDKSRIMPAQPLDTLIMETDTLINNSYE